MSTWKSALTSVAIIPLICNTETWLPKSSANYKVVGFYNALKQKTKKHLHLQLEAEMKTLANAVSKSVSKELKICNITTFLQLHFH